MERKEKGYLASEVEEKLGITVTERKRWLNEGKIHYNGNQEYFRTRYGWKYIGLYDDEEIDKITTEEIEKWRDEHKKEISEKRRIAAEKAKKTRVINNEIRKKNEILTRNLKCDYGEENALLIQTLYWMICLSYLADEEYYERRLKDSLYVKKNEMIRFLCKNFEDKVDIDLYKSDTPRENVDLCSCHFQHFKEDWNLFNYGLYTKNDIKEWCKSNKEVEKCPYCNVGKDYNYYSLFKVKFDVCGKKFLFNMPYPIAYKYLPYYCFSKDRKVVYEMVNTTNDPESGYDIGYSFTNKDRKKQIIENFDKISEQLKDFVNSKK